MRTVTSQVKADIMPANRPPFEMRMFAALSIFLFPVLAAAEPTYFAALDVRKCTRWTITNEVVDGASERFRAALELANSQALSFHRPLPREEVEKLSDVERAQMATVFTSNEEGNGSRAASSTRHGVCRFEFRPGGVSGLECLAGPDFPLSGARYLPIRFAGELPTLECVSGCAGSPQRIYMLAYEDDGYRNIEWEAALKHFTKTCSRSSNLAR